MKKVMSHISKEQLIMDKPWTPKVTKIWEHDQVRSAERKITKLDRVSSIRVPSVDNTMG